MVDSIPEDVTGATSGVVLYIPTVYNFPAVDAVLVVTGPEAQRWYPVSRLQFPRHIQTQKRCSPGSGICGHPS